VAHKLLQAHIRESDRWHGEPLHEVIVRRCRELGIAGASVFRGLEGYGSTADIVRGHLAGHDLPLVVVVVDTEENIARLEPNIEEMVDKGLIAIESVSARRVFRPPVLQ
jgi:uncharacterized protein